MCGTHLAMKKNEIGFTLVHFRRLLPTWEQLFVFPSQIQQVFFSNFLQDLG
jgi:hypothetical protein